MRFSRSALIVMLAAVVTACGSTTPKKPDPKPDTPKAAGGTAPEKTAMVPAPSDGPSTDAPVAAAAVSKGPGGPGGPGRPGFEVIEMDGRLWIFRSGSEALVSFLSGGEPAKRITRIGAGPEGETVMSSSGETLDSYAAALKYGRPGFAVFEEDGRLWVFREDGDGLKEFIEVGEPAKRITRIGAGPDGKTIMAPDAETLDAFLAR